MRSALTTVLLTVALLAVTAKLGFAASDVGHDGGEGWYGETNDKVVTNFGFFLIAFFPLFVLVASLIQWRLDKRKQARLEAAKARQARVDVRGGW